MSAEPASRETARANPSGSPFRSRSVSCSSGLPSAGQRQQPGGHDGGELPPRFGRGQHRRLRPERGVGQPALLRGERRGGAERGRLSARQSAGPSRPAAVRGTGPAVRRRRGGSGRGARGRGPRPARRGPGRAACAFGARRAGAVDPEGRSSEQPVGRRRTAVRTSAARVTSAVAAVEVFAVNSSSPWAHHRRSGCVWPYRKRSLPGKKEVKPGQAEKIRRSLLPVSSTCRPRLRRAPVRPAGRDPRASRRHRRTGWVIGRFRWMPGRGLEPPRGNPH